MFGFVKRIFLTVLLCVNLLSGNSLSCILIKNQECKTRPQVLNVNEDDTVLFFHLVLKQVNIVVVVIISIIRMQKFAFLLLQKT